MSEEKKSRRGMPRIVRWLLMAICLGVAIYELTIILQDQHAYKVADSEYATLSQQTFGSEETVAVPELTQVDLAEAEPQRPAPVHPDGVIDQNALSAINQDYIGWLYFPALEINYPVVYETYVDQYLYTTFEGQKNKAGCIFMDMLSNATFGGMSDFVFGHNMRNLSMFGSLKLLLKEDGADKLKPDPHIYVFTPRGTYEYTVFAYYRTQAGSDVYREIKTEDEYDSYLKDIEAQTLYHSDEELDFSEHPALLTLSTCNGAAGGNTRFVVHSVRTGTWEMAE